MEAFIMSHQQTETDLPEQELVDAYLPPCRVPHRIDHAKPTTIGGLAWPQESMSMRLDIDEAFERVPGVLEECRQLFRETFGRDIDPPVKPFKIEDAEIILLASATVATTTREVVRKRREQGQKIGMIKMKMMRPFPAESIRNMCRKAKKIGVLDRDYSSGVGGIWWIETKAAMYGHNGTMIQDYLTGMCGGDVTPDMIEEVIDDLMERKEAGRPVWKGIEE
jgi:pyruvate/2-oxoacid:ferredoxin oxidoreductase alpha subunit